jgi:DsbC/DsbD-like thiol-disulfide interchange protein
MRRLTYASILIGCVALVGARLAGQSQSRQPVAQTDGTKTDQGVAIAARHLRVLAGVSPRSAAPGTRVTLALDITPGKDIHVYAPEQAGYIPIELALDRSEDFKSAPARYPMPRQFYFEPLKETVKVYDRPFRVTLDVTLTDSPALRRRASNKDTLGVTGTLDYQACDDAVCYRPEQIALQWTILLIDR